MDWYGLFGKLWFALGVIVLLVVPVGLAWMGLGLIGVLFAAPIFGYVASRLLLNVGGGALTWMSRMPMRKWQGVYYAFNDVQVRVYEDDDQLWFVATDVLKSLDMRGIPDSFLAIYPDGCKVVPGTRLSALNPAALEAMLGKRNEREAVRFLLWMRREVVKPWEKKRGR